MVDTQGLSPEHSEAHGRYSGVVTRTNKHVAKIAEGLC